MTVKQILVRIRQKLNDVSKITYSDDELIYSLNNAIDSLSMQLAGDNDPRYVRSLKVSPDKPITKPDDFIAFVGQYPIELTEYEGNKVQIKLMDEYYPAGYMELKYHSLRPHVHKLDDVVPFESPLDLTTLINSAVDEVKPPEAQVTNA
jgi:hypothetical protein|nr:MAG TPA: hypothetical protein [Caudoviricetes sp.]